MPLTALPERRHGRQTTEAAKGERNGRECAKLVWPAAKKSIFITISDSHNEASVLVVPFTAPHQEPATCRRKTKRLAGWTSSSQVVVWLPGCSFEPVSSYINRFNEGCSAFRISPDLYLQLTHLFPILFNEKLRLSSFIQPLFKCIGRGPEVSLIYCTAVTALARLPRQFFTICTLFVLFVVLPL